MVDITVDATWLFCTYVTVAAPRLTAATDAELHVKVMNYVHEALQTLWALDKKLAVLVVFLTKAHLKKLNLPLLKLWVCPRTAAQPLTSKISTSVYVLKLRGKKINFNEIST